MPVKSAGIRLRGWWASYHRYILLWSLLNHLATGLNSIPSAAAKALLTLAPIPALPLRCNSAAWAGFLARHGKAPSCSKNERSPLLHSAQPHTRQALIPMSCVIKVPQGTNSKLQNLFAGVFLGTVFRNFPSIGMREAGEGTGRG